jgi:hypothetical protein
MTNPEQNKALVLQAFDTLFNKRDYTAAERFWSDRYIQHSAHIMPGRSGLFDLIRSAPETLRYENQLIVAGGDYVIAHGRFSGNGAARGLDCRRCCPHGRRQARRTLGRPAGRGDTGGISQRAADVRRSLHHLTDRRLDRSAWPGRPRASVLSSQGLRDATIGHREDETGGY